MYLSQYLSSLPHAKMPYQRKSIILQLNKTTEKLNTVGADRKTLNQTQFGRWVLRLITHRHTQTPKQNTPYHLHCFQTGSLYLYAKRARSGDVVKSGGAPCLGQKPPLYHILWGSLKSQWQNLTSLWLLLVS